jgi:putative transposase
MKSATAHNGHKGDSLWANDTPEQIICTLHQPEASFASGLTVSESDTELSISEATFHRWKNQYDAMSTNEAKRLKESCRRRSVARDLPRQVPYPVSSCRYRNIRVAYRERISGHLPRDREAVASRRALDGTSGWISSPNNRTVVRTRKHRWHLYLFPQPCGVFRIAEVLLDVVTSYLHL